MQASSSSTSLLSPPFFSMAVKHGPCLLTLKKGSKLFETSCMRKLLRISHLEHKANYCVRSKIKFFVVNRNLFWQLSKDGNLHGPGISYATTASRAPWRVGDAVVGRENAGWTTLKSGHPCPCQNCSQGPPAEKTGRGSLLNRP